MIEKIPDRIHIVFEKGLVVGTFSREDAAKRLASGRTKAGHKEVEVITYLRIQQD